MKKRIAFLVVSALSGTCLFAQTNIFPASGNTGIGTVTPAEKLTVLTASNVLGISHTNGTVKLATALNGSGAFLGTSTNHPLFLRTNSSPAQITLLQSGNVGINTTTPRSKLEVKGSDAYINTVRVGLGGIGSDTMSTNTCVGKYALSIVEYGSIVDVPGSAHGFDNTAIGFGAQNSNTWGSSNTATGTNALYVNSVGNNNTAMGANSLAQSFNGDNNSAFGFNSLSYASPVRTMNNVAVGAFALQFGSQEANTGVGVSALEQNTTSFNTAVGYRSLQKNTTGTNNVAIGVNALLNNKTANNNTAVGNEALFMNTTGTGNTALGYQSLDSNTTASENTSVGYNTLFKNKSGGFNTAVGYNALRNNIATSNTAVGHSALWTNSTGGFNTALGRFALNTNATGSQNTAAGNYSLYRNTSGNFNSAHGPYALYNNTTGTDNSAFGDNALYNNTTGSYNTAIGYSASPNSGILSNTTTVGYGAITTASNQVRIGNSSVTSIGGYVGWSNVSDGRIKRNVKKNVPGLKFINLLEPVTYTLDLVAASKIISMPVIGGEQKEDEKKDRPETGKASEAKQQIVYTGFIAQDVEKAAKKLDFDFSGVDAPKSDKDIYGIRYAEFVVPLVQAVQELSKQNEELYQQNQELKKEMVELKTLIKGKNVSTQDITLTDASLGQNMPNPFSNATSIPYMLPEKYSSAAIVITGNNGGIVKSITVNGYGLNTLSVSTKQLAAGTYQYSLIVDGKVADSKQMVISR